MPLTAPVRVQAPVSFPEIGDPARLISFLLMSAIKCDATAQFQAIADTARQLLDVPFCRVSIVDVGRARRMDRAERERLGFAGWSAFALEVATTAAPLKVDDTIEDERFRNAEDGPPGESWNSRMGVPLVTTGGACVGAICVGGESARGWGEDTRRALDSFARLVVHELELQAYALRDHATGLASQWAFEQFVKSCAETRVYPSVLLIGARVNDFEGHCERLGRSDAEQMLTAVGRSFAAALRSSDIVSRASGDRIIAACGLKAAQDAAICVRRIQSSLFETPELQPHGATLSLGLAEIREADLDGALSDLDAALYAARRMGTNKIVTADKLRQALELFRAGQAATPMQLLNTL